MKISSDEITSVIKKQIENYKVDLNVDEVGTVLEVGDGIAHIYGLENCMAGELLELPNGVYGMALNLEESNVGAVLLGRAETIKEGDTVKRTGRLMQVPVGDAVIGRVVNALGQPIDGKGEIKTPNSATLKLKHRALLTDSQSMYRCRLVSKVLTPWFRSAVVSVNLSSVTVVPVKPLSASIPF